MRRPTAVNAATTYGIDGSSSNNYGLGPSYRSTATKARHNHTAASSPSWTWLVVIIAIGIFLL